MLLHCNNNNCKYNDNQTCNADKIFYVDRFCVTFLKKPKADNYRDLMKPSFQPNCRRDNGNYKLNIGNVLKYKHIKNNVKKP